MKSYYKNLGHVASGVFLLCSETHAPSLIDYSDWSDSSFLAAHGCTVYKEKYNTFFFSVLAFLL
jgi:hypothetical protein